MASPLQRLRALAASVAQHTTAAGGPADEAMKVRAETVLPSLTHLDTSRMPDGYSQFFTRGEGCRVWDVDGKEYIDFMSSYGPISVGHGNPAVQQAIMDQMSKGDCLSGPSERMIELAEKLVELNSPWASWATFQKNGTDATSLAVRYARAYTNRRVLLRASGAYHGANHLWASGQGVLEEDHAHQLPFKFNDLDSVRAAIKQANGDFAAIIVSGFKWDFFQDLEMPTVAFLAGVRKLCDEHDAVLIMDDIRSAMRLDIRGTW